MQAECRTDASESAEGPTPLGRSRHGLADPGASENVPADPEGNVMERPHVSARRSRSAQLLQHALWFDGMGDNYVIGDSVRGRADANTELRSSAARIWNGDPSR